MLKTILSSLVEEADGAFKPPPPGERNGLNAAVAVDSVTVDPDLKQTGSSRRYQWLVLGNDAEFTSIGIAIEIEPVLPWTKFHYTILPELFRRPY